MMIRPTGITISLGGQHRAGDGNPVVARIVGWPLDGGETIHREMVVPAGGMVEQALPEGRYSVELTLPSGRILQRNVRIDEDTHEDFQFLEDFAPSASFSLQESIGWSDAEILDGAAAASGNTSEAEYSAALEKASRTQAPSQRRGLKENRRYRVAPPVELPAPPLSASLSVLSGTVEWDVASPRGAAAGPPIQPVRQAGDSALWRIGPTGDKGSGHRQWAQVTLPTGGIELASLPLPWYCSDGNANLAADVLVDPARSGASTTIAVNDPRMSGLLAYLDRGQAAVAAPLLKGLESDNLIEEVIFAKMVNPLAACAAAYVGLAVYPPGTAEKWDSWLANCMTRFPKIPDAAIVHARRLLLRPTGADDNARAAEALRKAAGAGVPYFSSGVLLLREMLLLLSADHADLKPLAETAGRLASRVDPGQAFTVLRFAPVAGIAT